MGLKDLPEDMEQEEFDNLKEFLSGFRLYNRQEFAEKVHFVSKIINFKPLVSENTETQDPHEGKFYHQWINKTEIYPI